MANTPFDEEASMRTTARRAAGTVALAGGAVLLRPGTRANKWMRRRIERKLQKKVAEQGRISPLKRSGSLERSPDAGEGHDERG